MQCRSSFRATSRSMNVLSDKRAIVAVVVPLLELGGGRPVVSAGGARSGSTTW
jgi:hypothetical protein